jgi:hypothetical protein
MIAITPLLVDTGARLIGYGAPWPEIAWVVLYVMFTAYLMLASRYVLRRLIELGPRIDELLDSPTASTAVAAWVRRYANRRLQIAGCLLGAAGVATVLGLVVEGGSSDPPVRAGWLVGVFVAMFFACDAVSWVVRYGRLVARVGNEAVLAVHTGAPVQTPAVRELRDFSATLAAITGVGLFFFSAPLLWLIVYVEGHGVDVAVLRTWSLVAFGVSAAISLYAAVAPQLSLALLVGAQRDRILDAIDRSIPKGDHTLLLEDEVAAQRQLFDAIAATRTSTIGVTAVAKWALGLLAPALPFVLSWLESSIGL